MNTHGLEPEQAASSPSKPAHSPPSWLKRFEPWGVLFTFVLMVVVSCSEYGDRLRARKVNAWQLLTTSAPGNSGKIEALEYLNGMDALWCPKWLNRCFFASKAPTPLDGIDLSQSDNGTPDHPGDDPAGVYLANVYLRGASIRNAKLSGANLFDADLRGADLSQTNLNNAEMYSVDLSDARLILAKLPGAYLGDANLSNADLRGADLSNTIMFGANVSGADLYGVNLTSADLTEANLSNANLDQANLTNAMLSGADLTDSKGLTQQRLNAACGDEHTKLSRRFTISRCKHSSSVERLK